MVPWLLLDVKLHFHDKIKTKLSSQYRPDLAIDDESPYYGMHFVAAPDEIHASDDITARILIRAYPEDPCTNLQPGAKVFVKEGRNTMAEGYITNRLIHQGAENTVIGVLKELSGSQ